MNIQTKAILIITSVSTALIALLAIVAQTVLSDGFLAVERSQVEDHTRRVQNLLTLEQDNLQRLVSDWGVWTDAYQYMHRQNRDFISSNLEATTYIANNIDVILYIRHDGKVVYGRQYNEDTEELEAIDTQLLQNFSADSAYLKLNQEDEVLSGLLTTDKQTYLIALSPVLNSDGSGTSPGVLMMAKIVDADFVQSLIDVLKLDITFFQNQDLDTPLVKSLIAAIQANNGFALQIINDHYVSGFGESDDIDNNVALVFKITVNRDIYHQGLITNHTMIIVAMIIAVCMALLTVLLIRKVVVNKISQIIRQLKQIQTGKDEPVNFTSVGDEISHLSKTIDELIEDFKNNANELGNAKDIADKNNKLKTQFLSQLSHELRTPLNAIIGFAELSKTYDMDIDNRDNIDHILTAGQHLLGLIEDLLDMSKLEMGKFDIRNEDFDIKKGIAESVELIENLARKFKVELHNDCVLNDTVFVHADYKRFKQIMLNLLSNAIKYNQKDGNVWVKCQQLDEKIIRIYVEDDGVGISAENIDKIFEPYERGDAYKTFIPGTGIGLAITRELVLAMNGKIGVESELGQGSRFWVDMEIVHT